MSEQKIMRALAKAKYEYINGKFTIPFDESSNVVYQAGRRDGIIVGMDTMMRAVQTAIAEREKDDPEL